MHLGTATINEFSACVVDLLHEVDKAVNLGIGRIEVVVVDVELGSTISVAGSLEGNVHETLVVF